VHHHLKLAQINQAEYLFESNLALSNEMHFTVQCTVSYSLICVLLTLCLERYFLRKLCACLCQCVLQFATDAFFQKYFCAFISPFLTQEIPEEHSN